MTFPVLNSLKSAFHHINRYLVEKYYENQSRYLVDIKDLSSVQCIVLCSPTFEQLGPRDY